MEKGIHFIRISIMKKDTSGNGLKINLYNSQNQLLCHFGLEN